jgi:hypothetical protein
MDVHIARQEREVVGVQEQREVAVAAGTMIPDDGFKPTWIYHYPYG